jgi:hypothetical protein
MPSALFRDQPEYSYTPQEQLDRCPITELRLRLSEPLVAAGVQRDQLLEVQQRESDLRRLIAIRLEDAGVRAAVAAAFEEVGELGDIRKFSLYVFDRARAARLARLGLAAALVDQPFGPQGLKLDRAATSRSPELGRLLDLRFTGPIRAPAGGAQTGAAELRIYLDLGYWADAYREDDDLGARVTAALTEYLGPQNEPSTLIHGGRSRAPSGSGLVSR